jgi:hypothetical protein
MTGFPLSDHIGALSVLSARQAGRPRPLAALQPIPTAAVIPAGACPELDSGSRNPYVRLSPLSFQRKLESYSDTRQSLTERHLTLPFVSFSMLLLAAKVTKTCLPCLPAGRRQAGSPARLQSLGELLSKSTTDKRTPPSSYATGIASTRQTTFVACRKL